jgi:fatty-acyl-CoA synthase
MELSKIITKEDLLAITRQFLHEMGYENREVDLDTLWRDHLGLTSLARIELIRCIESQIKIKLDNQVIAGIDSLRQLMDAIIKLNLIQKNFIQREHKAEQPDINLSEANTLIEILLLYGQLNPERQHALFPDEQGKESIVTYGRLLENSLKIAQSLTDRGLVAGDIVGIMLPTHPIFLYTFFGVLVAKGIPMPIYPLLWPSMYESYAKYEAKILQNTNIRFLLTLQASPPLTRLLRQTVSGLKQVVTANELLANKKMAPISRIRKENIALIAHTSGSTGSPKGVVLTHQNILTNIQGFGEAIGVTKNDTVVSWLPLYQDMGLIGMLLNSFYHGIPITLLPPSAFLNRPERWLWAIHYHNATISGSPNFAYELCAQKIKPEYIEGLNLSTWRLAINGADKIHPMTIENFSKKFGHYGFKRQSFLPVYELAESSFCLAVASPKKELRVDKIERSLFENQGLAIETHTHSEQASLQFVSCGKALAHHKVRVVDDKGNVLPDRRVGNLQFKGLSSMQGYYGDWEETRLIYQKGWWHTGDLAYLAEEEVFVTGRKKDMIIKSGRKVAPEEIEILVSQVSAIRHEGVIAFSVDYAGGEKLIIIAETSEINKSKRKKIIEEVKDKIRLILNIIPDQVILLPPNRIPKTYNSKLRRSVCKIFFLEGKFTKDVSILRRQLTKFKSQVILKTITYYLGKFGKVIYSIYVLPIFILTFLPIYLLIRIFPRFISATLCHYWAKIFFPLIFCPIKIVNKHNLYRDKNVIFVANHSSYLDAFLCFAVLPPKTRFVGKQELANAPIIRDVVRKLDHIMIDRGHFPEGILKAEQKIKQIVSDKNTILIFPEGTFSYPEGLRPFKLGAFRVSVETNTALLPIAIHGTRQILREGEYLLKPRLITVTVGELILPQNEDWQEIIRLRREAYEQIARNCGEPSLDFILAGKPTADFQIF